nr:DUF4040 domain-containing protein [Halostella salina]
MMVSALEVATLVFVLGTALTAALLRDVLGAIIAFAAYSLGVSILWVFLQAPDVALTEAAVGAGVMTILFLLTIVRTVRPPTDDLLESVGWRGVAAGGALSTLLLVTVPSLPAIGSDSPVTTGEVTAYYLENAYADTHVENAVTAVLAAYRGFDTLGEAVVVFAAGVAVLVVLRQEEFV